MEWQELKNCFTMATVESGECIEQAMIQFCLHIKNHVIPKNDGVAWDYLRIEFWSDSGRMIVFPSSTSVSGRIEKAGCQVAFADLLAQYEQLADSDLNDDAFVAALREAEQEWIEKFLDASRQASLKGYHFQFWDGEGERAIWDNRQQ